MPEVDPKLSMLVAPPDLGDNVSVAAASFAKGVELAAAGNPTDAYPLFVSTVTTDPTHAAAWYHIGTLLFVDKRFSAARAAMERVNELRPNNPRVLTNLGWYAHASSDTEAGYNYLKRAVELGPDLALGWSNLSQVQIARGDVTGALLSAKRGLDLCNDGNPTHAMSLAFCYLFNGDLQDGLTQYKARFRYKLQPFLSYAYPFWNGEPVETLFLRAEQGIGDTLTTLRFLPEVSRRVGRVLCYINSELRSLVEDMNLPNVSVHALPAVLPAAADAWLPMMDLPLALGLETVDIVERFAPPYMPVYKTPHKETVDKNIGIVWAGSAAMDLDQWRSMPLGAFMPLTYLPGVKLFTMQVGSPKEQIITEGMHGLIEDLGPVLTDMRETARVISNLDLIISVCTSTAHLSAAMGKPTWVIRNRRSSDWRWGLGEGYPSKWYPQTRIFERDYHEQWSDVIQRVKEALINGD